MLPGCFSAGGLVTAVAPVVVDCDGLWVGWTGLQDFLPGKDVVPEPGPGDLTPAARNILPVHIESQEGATIYIHRREALSSASRASL